MPNEFYWRRMIQSYIIFYWNDTSRWYQTTQELCTYCKTLNYHPDPAVESKSNNMYVQVYTD